MDYIVGVGWVVGSVTRFKQVYLHMGGKTGENKGKIGGEFCQKGLGQLNVSWVRQWGSYNFQ